MDILDFSINVKVDYGKNNQYSLKKLWEMIDDKNNTMTLPTKVEALAGVEKEVCACSYLDDAIESFKKKDPNWYTDHLKYLALGIRMWQENFELLDKLWDARFAAIRARKPKLEKTPNPIVRLLVGALAMLFLAAAAGVFLVPDLLPVIQEYSAQVLLGVLALIVIPIGLIFSIFGIICAVGILGVAGESIGPWLAKQGPFLQNWLAPLVVVLVLAIIGLILLLKFRSMPSRAKAKAKYKAEMETYHTWALQKIAEAEKYIMGCRLMLVMKHDKFKDFGAKTVGEENRKLWEGKDLSGIYILIGLHKLLEHYEVYDKRLEEMKAELSK